MGIDEAGRGPVLGKKNLARKLGPYSLCIFKHIRKLCGIPNMQIAYQECAVDLIDMKKGVDVNEKLIL